MDHKYKSTDSTDWDLLSLVLVFIILVGAFLILLGCASTKSAWSFESPKDQKELCHQTYAGGPVVCPKPAVATSGRDLCGEAAPCGKLSHP
jgi:hypothetical protein